MEFKMEKIEVAPQDQRDYENDMPAPRKSKFSKVMRSFGDNQNNNSQKTTAFLTNTEGQGNGDTQALLSQNNYKYNDETSVSQPGLAMARSLDSKGNPKLILYKRRWIILLCFSLALIASGMAMGTCVTISPLLKKLYGISAFEANFANLIYLVMYIPFNFVSIIVLKTYGLKVCIIIGAIVTIVGGWLRLLLVWTNFHVFLGASAICASSQPFLLNNPSKVASNWFGDKERGIATAIGSMAIPVGTLISFIMPNAFISNDDMADIEKATRNFEIYVIVQTAIITVLCIPALIFTQEEPPSPPSVIANETNNKMGMAEGVKELFTNRNYIILFLIFNFIYGIHSSIGGTIASVASGYGYGVSACSTMCFVYLTGGIFNSFFLGVILDKYQAYRKLVMIVCVVSVISCGIHLVALPTGNVLFESFAMMLVGAAVLPITNISYSFAVELTFPVPEVITNGMMISISLVWGVSLGILCQALADIDPRYTLAFWTLSSIIALILSCFLKQELRRLDLDDVKNSEYIEDDEFRRQSYEQREAFLRESGFEEDMKFKFEFDLMDKEKNKNTFLKVNKSFDNGNN
ncbi:major facilitator superfamily protein [Stylonychia lemnae]|uniref:Major facilitator superfamily protein n=1 Tax=Stylonychia lemnae TaxID=5949 RepID=A0A078B823_STYLE|nr:major facilitator superfamily protein [Stylonychia lemnae]|eukprot:CDW89422.1 major facilitator superfamily protein [Stylonychia lemnae]